MLTNDTVRTDDDDRTEQTNELLAELLDLHQRWRDVEQRILASHLAIARAKLRTRDILGDTLGEGQHQVGPWDVSIRVDDRNHWVVQAVRA